jgi:hypothetical protein
LLKEQWPSRQASLDVSDLGGDEDREAIATRPNKVMFRHKRYPRWKRNVGTSLIHLFRGALLVCRLIH